MRISASIIAHLRGCHQQVQHVHTVFPVATIFSHWIVCSVCKTCILHCNLGQKQACSRSSPFGLLIPEPFSLWQPERSWILSVGRLVCKHPIFFVLRETLCYHRLLCKNRWLLNRRDSVKGWFISQPTGMTVSPAPESTTRGFGTGAQALC